MTDLDDDDMYDYISDGGDDADADYENNNNNDDYEYGLANQEPPQQQYYTILNEEDIRKRQEDDVTTVSTVLSVSKAWASILLHNFHWSVNRVHDAWFADADSVRQTVGLLEKSVVFAVVPKNDQLVRLITCGICFEACSRDEISSAVCGHPYCKTCWEGYITTSINNGPGCLTLRCPDPDCKAAVGQDMIDIFVASDEDSRKKYYRYQTRSYIEHNKKTKWCPAPGCDFAVEFVVGSECYDITCLCSRSFCWNCAEETHRPVDCATVLKWMIKNSCESANMEWVLAFTKPCPKCKRPIEKNDGCMHMTCSKPCGYHFCWLCLGDIMHKEKPCNRYAMENGGPENEDERRRKMAKKSLRRYMHYYERWATNEKSRKKALEDLNQMETVRIKKLSDIQCQPETRLAFLTDAWLQIVECRRVLKWTYGYGYYIPEHERAKKNFFEYLQGEAETGLERLHQCAEKELQQFLRPKGPSSERFNEFRSKLTGLTDVTKTYFENLVRALENGLSDVDSPWDYQPTQGKLAWKTWEERQVYAWEGY